MNYPTPRIIDPSGCDLFVVRDANNHIIIGAGDKVFREQIVLAVNSHAELVAACEMALKIRAPAGRDYGRAMEFCDRAEIQIRAALAAATVTETKGA